MGDRRRVWGGGRGWGRLSQPPHHRSGSRQQPNIVNMYINMDTKIEMDTNIGKFQYMHIEGGATAT